MTRASLATVYPSILTSYFCAQWWVLVACLVGLWVALGGLSGAMGWVWGSWGGIGLGEDARGAMGPWLACVWVLRCLAGGPGALVGLVGGLAVGLGAWLA